MTIPALLIEDPARVRAALFERFTKAYPGQGAAILPEGAREMPQILLDVTSFTLTHSPTPDLPPGVARRLRSWALDLRRIGFPAGEFVTVAGMIADVAGMGENERAVLVSAAEEMRDSAEAADLSGVPAATAAQVVDVVHEPGATVVRLESGAPVSYLAGQVFPVMHVGLQGVWQGLAPALPPNNLGHLEFHLADARAGADGGAGAVAGAGEVAAGDYLTLGAARGKVPRLDGPTLIVAAGTGLAAAKALVFSLLERDIRPEVHLAIAAETPAELYDLPTFAALAKAHDWLRVVCVVEDWPVDKNESPALELGLQQMWAPLAAAVSGPGTWWGREIVLCGPEAQVTPLRRAFVDAGAPEEDLTVIAHDAAPQWAEPL